MPDAYGCFLLHVNSAAAASTTAKMSQLMRPSAMTTGATATIRPVAHHRLPPIWRCSTTNARKQANSMKAQTE